MSDAEIKEHLQEMRALEAMARSLCGDHLLVKAGARHYEQYKCRHVVMLLLTKNWHNERMSYSPSLLYPGP